jgi:hypothetical protein
MTKKSFGTALRQVWKRFGKTRETPMFHALTHTHTRTHTNLKVFKNNSKKQKGAETGVFWDWVEACLIGFSLQGETNQSASDPPAGLRYAMSGKVNMEKVMRTIKELEGNAEWLVYVETLAEVLDELIDKVREEIGKETNTASLRFTGVIPNIKEKIQSFAKVTFFDGEIVEMLKVVNHFLKDYGLQIHPIAKKGLFVSRNGSKGTLVDELERRFMQKLQG